MGIVSNKPSHSNGGEFRNRIIFNADNSGPVSVAPINVADLGIILQIGDEIILNMDIGTAHVFWNGAIAIGGVASSVASNKITFTQVGTMLKMSAANTSGTRRWLKVIRD